MKLFSNAEKGALLQAVGGQMVAHDLMLGAALDGNSNADMKPQIVMILRGAGYDSESANKTADDLLELSEDDLIRTLQSEDAT
jgi:hypothetical protein